MAVGHRADGDPLWQVPRKRRRDWLVTSDFQPDDSPPRIQAPGKGEEMQKFETDYLDIGSGAVSLAFVDAMLTESAATFLIVDRHHMPGGHWNDAYPFVRLHQPSSTYGVASRQLGANRIDESGSNKGYYELASGQEVLPYFEQLMREQFLPSGRVQYFPMCDYLGEGRFRSLLPGAEPEVKTAKKTVDGTNFKTRVPSTHKRQFSVADGVACVAPNDLPRVRPGGGDLPLQSGRCHFLGQCIHFAPPYSAPLTGPTALPQCRVGQCRA